jgi:hypothetical protein
MPQEAQGLAAGHHLVHTDIARVQMRFEVWGFLGR